ncbi:hypothetical protein HN789_04500 [archaeon]|nr:hypothetical protein [archaeon]MBT4022470.1 hypothetical protein [archaeon]MBT4272625.1 hypothetical protein [archaeon]MBT4461209.1 hypothetical protein [archaeon]MBT4858277.1 hypothetical protein [archaeon]
MKSTANKGQAEIIGLVLVVILLVIIIFFILFSNKNIDNKNDIIDSQLSQSVLNILMRTDTQCGPDFSVIIQDCFNDNSKCPGSNSCDYATFEIKKIFSETLDKWQKPYIFYAKKSSDKKIEFSYGGCTDFKEKAYLATSIISDEPNNIVVSLGICKP